MIDIVFSRNKSTTYDMTSEGTDVRRASSLCSWWGTSRMNLLEVGFPLGTASPCVYKLAYGAVLLLLYVDDVLLAGIGNDNAFEG